MSRRERRTFTKEFKTQIVQLIENGKPRHEVIKEYDLGSSTVDRWLRQYRTSGSFSNVDNLTDEQKEIRRLKKELKQSQLENEILKAAALILGRKDN